MAGRGSSAPRLVVVEQPEARGMRFRYVSEGTTAGALLGERTTERNKSYPSVRLLNWPGAAVVRACLVTSESPHRPHAHSLVGLHCQDGVFCYSVTPGCSVVRLMNVGIQCVKKAEVQDAAKKRLDVMNPYKVPAESTVRPEEMELTAVRICFQATLSTGDVLPPLLSVVIFDKKSTRASKLEIARINRTHGSVRGSDEVMLFCEKVQKDDIQVIFSRGDWQAQGAFSTGDVHRQVVIVFKTPAFHDLNICKPVQVSIFLYRPSDQQCSDGHNFLYIPEQDDAFGVERKRKQTPETLQRFANYVHAGSSGPAGAPAGQPAGPARPAGPGQATRFSKRLNPSRRGAPSAAAAPPSRVPPSPPAGPAAPQRRNPPRRAAAENPFVSASPALSSRTVLDVTMSQGRMLEARRARVKEEPAAWRAPAAAARDCGAAAAFTDDQVDQIEAIVLRDPTITRLMSGPAPGGLAVPVSPAPTVELDEAALAAMDLVQLEDVGSLLADSEDEGAEYSLAGRPHMGDFPDMDLLDGTLPEELLQQ